MTKTLCCTAMESFFVTIRGKGRAQLRLRVVLCLKRDPFMQLTLHFHCPGAPFISLYVRLSKKISYICEKYGYKIYDGYEKVYH